MILWCAAATAAGAQDASPSPAPAAAAEVERLERELVRAIEALDLETYDRIVADDYVVVGMSGTETTKAEVMASYRSGDRQYPGLEISEVRAYVFGDTAIVAARASGFRQEREVRTVNNVRYVRVFARRDGRWRAVAQMAAPLPKP
jgi:ketosteroid isomerase-like protein